MGIIQTLTRYVEQYSTELHTNDQPEKDKIIDFRSDQLDIMERNENESEGNNDYSIEQVMDNICTSVHNFNQNVDKHVTNFIEQSNKRSYEFLHQQQTLHNTNE